MKLEINTNGSWRTVITGLSTMDRQSEDRLLDAKTAAAMLAEVSTAVNRKPITWRLVSEATDQVIERCCGADGWQQAFRPEVEA